MGKKLGQAISAARRQRDLTQQEVADHIGISRAAVTQWETGETEPSTMNLLKAVDLLGPDLLTISADSFRRTPVPTIPSSEPLSGTDDGRPGFGERGRPPDTDEKRRKLLATTPTEMPQDVPVHGITVGGEDADFTFNGEVTDYVRRPPGIRHARKVYALYVVNDSMSPKFEPGDLVYVAPSREPSAGDYVVVQLYAQDDGEREGGGRSFIKRLKKRTPTKMVLEQFNPAADLEFEREWVKAVHRVIPLNELLGV